MACGIDEVNMASSFKQSPDKQSGCKMASSYVKEECGKGHQNEALWGSIEGRDGSQVWG